jgi:hypothetical protein
MMKNASSMCRVGKFMVSWKEKDTIAHAQAAPTWNNAIRELKSWPEDVKTDPSLTQTIMESLEPWRDNTPTSTYFSPRLLPAIEKQNDVGWQHSLKALQIENGSSSKKNITKKSCL